MSIITPTGAAAIPTALYANRIAVSPSFRYRGEDAAAGTWAYWVYGGESLTQAGSGTAPSYLQSNSPLGAPDLSVLFGSGYRLESSGSSVGDITTEDFAVHAVVKLSSNAANRCVMFKRGDRDDPQHFIGWILYFSDAHKASFMVSSVSGSSTLESPSGLTTGAWYDIWAFVDRSEASTNGAALFVNGTLETQLDMSARSGTITNAGTLVVGAFPLGSSPNETWTWTYDSHIASLAMYKQAAWFPGGSSNIEQWSRIAWEQHKLWIGA
ncbi:MAG: hypothetical protein IT371_11180 [Deltaproteobacteria bacterium]|nr:hypothetical protein [Deltaproteobacteria bacterium]